MISFLKLIRYPNLLMILLTMLLTKYALLAAYMHRTFLSDVQFALLILSVLCIAASGNIINDIYDMEADKINKPSKVYINTFITKKKAWTLYYGMATIGLLLGIYLSITTTLYAYSAIFIFSILILHWYSYLLKKVLLLGNLVVSLATGLSIYIVYLFDFKHIKAPELEVNTQINSLFDTQLWVVIVTYACFAVLTNLIREIIKDVEDVHGDLNIKANTLPIVFGKKRAKKIAVAISVVVLFSLVQIAKNHLYPFPILLGYTFVFILIPLTYFTYKLWNATTTKEFHYASNLMKLIMLSGTLSMLFFKFI